MRDELAILKNIDNDMLSKFCNGEAVYLITPVTTSTTMYDIVNAVGYAQVINPDKYFEESFAEKVKPISEYKESDSLIDELPEIEEDISDVLDDSVKEVAEEIVKQPKEEKNTRANGYKCMVDKAKLKEMYLDGKKIPYIARYFDVGPETIRYHLKKMGLKPGAEFVTYSDNEEV